MGQWTKICEDIELALAFGLSPTWGDNEDWENVAETYIHLIYLRVEKLSPGLEDEIFTITKREWLTKVAALVDFKFDGKSNAVDTVREIYKRLGEKIALEAL